MNNEQCYFSNTATHAIGLLVIELLVCLIPARVHLFIATYSQLHLLRRHLKFQTYTLNSTLLIF